MNNEVDGPEESRLQKAVETIVMTPEAAAKVVDGYRAAFEDKNERKPESLEDKRRIAAKIIGRYSKLSAAAGAVTAAPGVIPGIGTAVAVVSGGVADTAAALKLQVDMCMCLVEVFETELSAEDKKHLAFTLALASSVEKMASKGGKAAVMKIAEKLVYQYLTGPALVTIKQLFKRVSITFTQKAMAKAIPAGIGVAFSSSTNYVLTRVVGGVAVAVLAKDVK
ncbi:MULTISPECIES: EcsC family protein [Streptomyces]|uniref:EcsC family protein n=1 Tax=Streptomyces sudanensis TaxID=436397 RepID=A0ABY4T9W0_9ACTN|nr:MULTISPECIES: EcsC family protein [Streptomyces]URN15035.1 EcsC family protein [Streptomyces sudanensis]